MEEIIKEINKYFHSNKYDFDYEIDEDIIYYNISFGTRILNLQIEYCEDSECYVQIFVSEPDFDFGMFKFKTLEYFIPEFEESLNQFKSYLRCRKKVFALLEEIKECIDEANIGLDSDEIALNIDL